MHIPSCESVDFTDVDDVHGCAHLMLSLCQHIGVFSGQLADTQAYRDLRREMKQWILRVEAGVDKLPIHQVIRVLDLFDMMHRVVFHVPSSSDFLNKWYLAVFDSKLHGNQNVAETELFKIVSDAIICRRDRAYVGKPLKWYTKTIAEWIEQVPFESYQPRHEAVAKAANLIALDLKIYVSSQLEFKQKLVEHFRPMLDDVASCDDKTLTSCLELVQQSRYRFMAESQADAYDRAIREALSSSPTINPHERQAFALDLKIRDLITHNS